MQQTKLLQKHLSTLLSGLSILCKRGEQDPFITGLTYDSRAVEPGYLFFAFDGLHSDGHLFVDKAIERGALAVIHSKELAYYHEQIVYIQLENTREALSSASAAFYDFPSRDLITIGVTGTDGKSTTVYLIYQLLSLLGEKAGFISTVNITTNGQLQKNPFRQSTPEANEIQRMLHEIRAQHSNSAQGVQPPLYAVIEATSHGLSDKTSRLKDVIFNAGVLTNITHEHLEFHGSLDQYRQDKANLFRYLGKRAREKKQTPKGNSVFFGVVNFDDPTHTICRTAASCPVYTYSLIDKQADLYAEIHQSDLKGTHFTLHLGNESVETFLPLPGLFNVANASAATLTVSQLLALPLSTVSPLISKLKGPTGRMEIIDCGQPFQVIIDYAHTPEAFEKIFALIRPHTKRQLIAVFGSAGERDTQKRPLQGAVAGRHADVVILTNEDPRGEDAMAILEDIAKGCSHLERESQLFLIPDRRTAIKRALELAQAGDTVVCLGKGHEANMIFSKGPLPWDEMAITKELLKARKAE